MRLLHVFLLVAALTAVRAQDTQKFSLGTASGDRFTTPDITWPAAHGDADVCLWEDDKLSAVSLTIDDNNAMNIEWWLAEAESLDFKFTWFIITGNVNGVYDPATTFKSGTWEQWRQVYAAGHAVQAHSASHGDTALFRYLYGTDYTEDYYHFYDGARQAIEDSMPGNRCLTMAAPGGSGIDNNLDSAALYFIANRGTNAQPQNANTINFKDTRNSSRFIESHVNSIIDDTTLIWGKNYRRGWACFLWHYVSSAPDIRASLQYLKDREDSLWVARYPDLVRYNMEYATHTLTPVETSDSLISFTLTDEMADSIYTYPLTVKVRLNNDWDTCIATQNGEVVDVSVVAHEGDKYALVKAVPDNGEVMLATTGAPVSVIRPVTGLHNAAASPAVYYDCRGRRLSTVPTVPGIYLMGSGNGLQKTVILN